jgi:GNAT superfamily N-acetyltransferase
MTEVTTTYLQMTTAADLRPQKSRDPLFDVREAMVPQWQVNRFLYCLVGEQWAWIDKRSWTDEQWKSYVASEQLRTFVALFGGSIAGYYELHRDDARAVEIVYFGLAPEFIGRGLGGALLSDAISRAWAWDASRVWVHTCTHDHPAALANYQSRGMQIYHRETRQVA